MNDRLNCHRYKYETGEIIAAALTGTPGCFNWMVRLHDLRAKNGVQVFPPAPTQESQCYVYSRFYGTEAQTDKP